MVGMAVHAHTGTDMADMRADPDAVAADTGADADTAHMDAGFHRIRVRRTGA